jgi:hypothetical protein
MEVREAVEVLVKCAYGTGDDEEILDERIGGIKKRRKEENDSVTIWMRFIKVVA